MRHSDESTDVVVRESRDPVLVLRLNRPDARNALDRAVIGALGSAILDAESDPAVRAVVLTGTGDRAFCAGMDLAEFAGGGGLAVPEQHIAAFLRLMEGDVSVPVVGAANATAVAGGFELLLGCDLLVASSEAKFGLPEVKRGLIAGRGAMHIGAHLPLAVALEMALTGALIDARRAYDLGLVNAVVSPGEVLSTALGYAQRIAANGPLAVAATKEMVRTAVADRARARERLGELEPKVFGSDDAKEGATAFVEKRPPQWKGH